MLDDSERALEINKDYFKAYLRKGEALVEIGKGDKHSDTKMIDEGIQYLKKAL